MDIAAMPRVWRAFERFGDRFLQRAYHPAEAAWARQLAARGPHGPSSPTAAFLASRCGRRAHLRCTCMRVWWDVGGGAVCEIARALSRGVGGAVRFG